MPITGTRNFSAQGTFSEPHSSPKRHGTCCRVAMCSSMAIAPMSAALPTAASSKLHEDLQQQLASSAAALAPVHQAVSDAFAAAAAAVSQRNRSADGKPANTLVQAAAPAERFAPPAAVAATVAGSKAKLRSQRTASSTKALRQLTTAITQCTSWLELRFLYTTAGQQMNIIHISACLSTLGKLLRATPAEPWQLQELEQFMQQLERSSANMLSVLQMPQTGALQVYCTGSFMQHSSGSSCCLQQAVPVLPQQLSTMAWGCATVGFSPGRHWWSCYWAAGTPQLPAYTPQELATTLWAAAKLQQHPPPAWLAGFWQASTAAMQQASPQEICMMLWGAVQLKLQPDSSWWSELRAAVTNKQGQMTARDFAQVLWAHAQLRAQPPPLWSPQLLQSCQMLVHRFSPRDAAMLLWSCAVLQQQPGQQFLDSMLQCLMISNSKLDASSPQDFAHILWALAVFRQSNQMSSSRDASTTWQPQQSGTCSSSSSCSCSDTLSSNSNARRSLFVSTPLYNSPPCVSQACCSASSEDSSSSSNIYSRKANMGAAYSNSSSTESSATAWHSGSSSAVMMVSQPVLQSWAGLTWGRLRPSIAGMNPTDAAQLLWAAVQLGPSCWPSQAWMEQYWLSSRQVLVRGAIQHAARHSCTDVREASGAGGGGVCAQDAVHAPDSCSSPAYSAQAICLSMWAGLRIGAPPPRNWLVAALPPLQQQLAELQPAAVCQLLYVLARLQHRPNPDLMQQLLSRVQLDAHLLQPRAFVCILWSLGRLGFEPGPNWWDVLLHHLSAHVMGLKHKELQHVLYGLVALQPAVPRSLQRALQQRAALLQQAEDQNRLEQQQ